jgi:16S rRNA U1498 N3-methylase RsmE
MSKQRFVGSFDLAQKELLVTDREMINQAKNVLRLASGDELWLVSDGQEALSEIVSLTKDELLLAIKETKKIVS